jgi:hypothetical protein
MYRSFSFGGIGSVATSLRGELRPQRLEHEEGRSEQRHRPDDEQHRMRQRPVQRGRVDALRHADEALAMVALRIGSGGA